MDSRFSFAEAVSLGGDTHTLNVGWLRSSCDGLSSMPPEPRAQVYRCRGDVFEVGDEQACELLVEEPATDMDVATSRYALP